MLAVPGALVALGLAYLAALGTVERDRRDLALLRARGAARRDLLGPRRRREPAARRRRRRCSAPALALARRAPSPARRGGVGVGRALVDVRHLRRARGARRRSCAHRRAGLAVFRAEVGESRRSVRRDADRRSGSGSISTSSRSPSAGLVYWLTARTGFSAVVNPDSNPTLSLSVYMFLAPALLWLGATLLLVRLRGGAVAWLCRADRRRPRATTWPGFLLASAGRRGAGDQPRPPRRRAAARVRRRARHLHRHLRPAGARRRTAHPRRRRRRHRAAGRRSRSTASSHGSRSVRASRASTAVDHSYAYVGPDLQDTFGIDPATFTRGVEPSRLVLPRRQARADMLARLRLDATTASSSRRRRSPTTRSHLGDLLRLRVLDHATGTFPHRAVPRRRHRAGVPVRAEGLVHGREPRATSQPVDARSAARTSSSSRVAATRSRSRAASPPRRRADGTTVRDIREQTAQTVSSITTVDLRGIARIEEVFALVLAAAAMALFVGVALAERRQELATMAALGASLRPVGAFLWSEAALVLVGRARARSGARLAAGGDARRDAPARLRSAAGPARGPVGRSSPALAGAALVAGLLATLLAALADPPPAARRRPPRGMMSAMQ